MKAKHIFSMAMAVCLLAGSIVSPAAYAAEAQPSAAVLYGDANLDEAVDVSDAVLIARFCAEDKNVQLNALGQLYADVDLNRTIDMADVTAILQYIARLRKELGVPNDLIQSEPEYKAVNLTADADTVKVASKKADDKFIASQCSLTVDLLHEANQLSKDENLMISPLSISQALAMTANGAKGQTLDEMVNVLGGGIPIDDLNAYYYGYTGSLKNTAGAKLKQANSIWICDDETMIQVPDAFLQIVKSNYDAQVFRAPFDDTTLTDVNNWASYHTDNMIPNLLDRVEPNTVMYLINALCFDALWAKPYADYQVHDGKFTTAGGQTIAAEMMNGEEDIYLQDDHAVGFVKYYQDFNYSFAAVLPNEDIPLSDYIAQMTGESLQKLLDSRSSETVYTQMPKFSYDYKILLNEPLQNMGMPTAFDEFAADFTGLDSLGGTYISKVLHKTHITVNEVGTKAAAVTVVEMGKNGMPLESKTVTLDRPFLYMILDENTKLPVFIGTVTDPTK